MTKRKTRSAATIAKHKATLAAKKLAAQENLDEKYERKDRVQPDEKGFEGPLPGQNNTTQIQAEVVARILKFGGIGNEMFVAQHVDDTLHTFELDDLTSAALVAFGIERG